MKDSLSETFADLEDDDYMILLRKTAGNFANCTIIVGPRKALKDFPGKPNDAAEYLMQFWLD